MIRSQVFAELLAAAAITVFAAWWLWQAFDLRSGPGYAAVGPRVFPMIVGVGLLASGLTLALGHLWRRWSVPTAPMSTSAESVESPRRNETAHSDERADWSTLFWMAALLAGYVLGFQSLGFIIASAAFLMAGAWILGSRSIIRDIVAGIGLSLVTYLVFTRLLGLELPGGLLAGLF